MGRLTISGRSRCADDVLVYTSAPLEQDLEVTGPIVVHLCASTDGPDTDFTAKLFDVYPDGSRLEPVRRHRPGALPQRAGAAEPGRRRARSTSSRSTAG